MTRWLGSILCVMGSVAYGCEASEESVVLSERSAIVDGERSPESENAVVRIIVPATETLCTGTLVASNVVITALHCIAQFDRFGDFDCDTQGVLVTSTPPDGEIGATVDPTGIEVHVGVLPDAVPDAYGRQVFGSGSLVICRNDIALVVLDRDIDAPIVPMRLTSPITRGERMIVVGYGETAQPPSVGRYHRGGVTVGDVGSSVTGVASGPSAPNTFVLGPGACQGDSGGPSLSEQTGAITGIYSLSAGISCTYSQIRNIYTQVAPFSSLITNAFEYAGKQPQVEVLLSAGGSGGSSGSGDSSVEVAGATAETGGHAATESPPGPAGNSSGGCSIGRPKPYRADELRFAWLLAAAGALWLARRTHRASSRFGQIAKPFETRETGVAPKRSSETLEVEVRLSNRSVSWTAAGGTASTQCRNDNLV